MTDIPVTAEAGRFEVRATADTHFGWLRTRLALERTMMSWERTAIAVIGFGFVIVQFFDQLQQMPGALRALHPNVPKFMGVALISCGVLALVISILAVLVGGHLLAKQIVRMRRRNGGKADAIHRGANAHRRNCDPSYWDRVVRLLRCTVWPRLVPAIYHRGWGNRSHRERRRPSALSATPRVPTLSELNKYEPHWLWWNCCGCRRWVAVPLAPFIIRWGAEASSDLLRTSPRCIRCGHRGGLLQVPSHHSLEIPYLSFPAQHGIRAQGPGA